MAPAPAPGSPGTAEDGVDGPAHVHLLVEEGADRRLLSGWLEGEYEITAGTTRESLGDPFDLCIVDGGNFRRHADALGERRRRDDLVFLPVLLITAARDDLGMGPRVWDHVDDLVEVPVRKAELRARLSNLIERRRTSMRLARTVSELELKDRAMDAAPTGVTITDPGRPDNPVVYANAAFERITGYDRDETVGRNMRFLQGPATDPAAVTALREALDDQEPVSVTLRNYRKDGSRFWNRVDIAPVRDGSGDVTNFVGFQTDVTDERIREQRLSVLNRLMRHNLSNDLNIVEGYAEILLDELDDPGRLAALRAIERSAEKLEKLGEDTARIERILDRCRAFEEPIDVERSIVGVCERVREAHPGADLSVDVEGGPWYVAGNCLAEAFAELVENAVRHSGSDAPSVRVSIRPRDGSNGGVEVRIVDDGPGIPDGVIEMLNEGRETKLKHGDGIGLWLATWVVTLVGGDITITSGGAGGTDVALTFPTTEPP